MRTYLSSPGTSSLCAIALLLSTAVFARSEDAPASPADRGQAVLSSLPAPSEKGAFKFDLDLSINGAPFGKASFQASVGAVDGTPAWKIEEHASFAMGDMKKSHETEATLAPDLHLLRFKSKDTDGDVATTTSVVRTATGFDVTKTDAEGAKESKIEADVHTMSTLSAVLLFLRLCPAEPATYGFHAYQREKSVVESGTIEVKGPGKFTEGEVSMDAWVVHALLGEQEMDLYFDKADRALIAISTAQGILMTKTGLLKATDKEMDTTQPAASATEDGARLALAILTSDEALLASVIHFPTMWADAKATGYLDDEATFKALVVSQFKATFKTMTRAQASAMVTKAAAGAKEEPSGDATFVTFGAPMDKFVYTAKAIEGVWYIVKMTK